MHPRADLTQQQPHTGWQRQPVVWLGILVFVASIAGCVWIIAVGTRYADTPVETSRSNVFGVPATPHHVPKPTPTVQPQ